MLGPSSPQERKKHPEKLPNNTFNIHIPLPPTQCGCTGMTLLASIISLARKILVNERECPGDRVPYIHSFVSSRSKSFAERKCISASKLHLLS